MPYQSRKLLVDKAQLLTLSALRMTVLVGGLRVLGADLDSQSTGYLPAAGILTNDFFTSPSIWARNGSRFHKMLMCLKAMTGTGEARWHRYACRSYLWPKCPLPGHRPRCTQVLTERRSFIQDFVAAWTQGDEP